MKAGVKHARENEIGRAVGLVDAAMFTTDRAALAYERNVTALGALKTPEKRGKHSTRSSSLQQIYARTCVNASERYTGIQLKCLPITNSIHCT